MPYLFILMPMIGIMILNIFFGKRLKRFAFWFAFALFFTQMIIAVFHRLITVETGSGYTDIFFKADFLTDHLSFIMLLSIGIVSFASILVSRHAIPEDKSRFKFINLLMVASIGMSGIAIVKDLFSLYVFLEITSISAFILIAFQRDILGLEGSFKYIMLSALATIAMLVAIAIFLLISESTSFDSIAAALKDSRSSRLVLLAIGLFLCGLFIKGGVVPFHGWLPDAYSAAPAPASVLLAGIVTKACGIYGIIRVVTSVFGFDETIKNILLIAGTVSMLVGAVAALGQKNLKRMLAYSSISQIGYIVVGFGTGTALGIAGAIFHFFNHAIFKSLLFVNASALEMETGTNEMDAMGGVSEKMPVTGTTSIIGFLSASGIPPLAGFWSKLIIVIALWKTGNYLYAVIAVLAGIITLAYLLTMQRRIFFGKLAAGLENLKEAGPGITTAAIFLAAITIVAGIFFPLIFDKLIMPMNGMALF
ncbi:MAG: proton-conducting transporter membrane subunit [Candidatus Omnitrophota bacterium]